jgi:predicted TIM-barrel fold metal-dependent hydrolase
VPDGLPIIDAHHHLWDLKRNHYPWLADAPETGFFLGDYSALKRDYMPADYRRDAAGHNVVATVHCEAEWDRNDQVGETLWLEQVTAEHGMPNAIVAHAWFDTENTAEVLARQAERPMVRGIRSKPRTGAAPGALAPDAPGSMGDPKWRAGLKRLEQHGLSYDLRVPPWHLKEAVDIVRLIPSTPVIVNHTGFPWDRSEAGVTMWRDAMRAMAGEPNVVVKLSEFGLKDAPWDYEQNRAIVLETIDLFGPERCMFASNFPVAGLRIGFDELYTAYKRMVAGFSDGERLALFHDTAARIYRLPLAASS